MTDNKSFFDLPVEEQIKMIREAAEAAWKEQDKIYKKYLKLSKKEEKMEDRKDTGF